MQFREQNGEADEQNNKAVSAAAQLVLAVIICAVLIIRQTHEDVLSKEAVVKKSKPPMKARSRK